MEAARFTTNHRWRCRDAEHDVVVIRQWTGQQANALRCAARMTVRGFAEYLGVSARAVARWAQYGTDTVPRPGMQAILDTALAKADLATQRRFDAATGGQIAGRPRMFRDRPSSRSR